MANTVNEIARGALTTALTGLDVEVNEVTLPLLGSSVTTIILDIKNGEVEKIRPLLILEK